MQELAEAYETAETYGNSYFSQIASQDSMIFWVNRIFSELQLLVDRFNRGLNHKSVQVNILPPDFHKLPPNENGTYHRDAVSFEGHLSLLHDTLLIRGLGEKIIVWIVPAEIWPGLSLNEINEQDYPPYAQMKVTAYSATVTIKKGQSFEVDLESVSTFSKLLFTQLVQRGSFAYTDLCD
ncbi:MAG: hypothetical protein K2X93_23535 [Candidatus Obscuribacterales bacterium]|nr:hypothetical protein [Candidatus Obscuribacterales bacterium]